MIGCGICIGVLYSDAVLAYMHAFKKVKVISFEDLKNNPQAVVDDICRFLGPRVHLKLTMTVS